MFEKFADFEKEVRERLEAIETKHSTSVEAAKNNQQLDSSVVTRIHYV